MSVPENIGWMTYFLDQMGITPVIQVVLIAGAALWVYHRFFGR